MNQPGARYSEETEFDKAGRAADFVLAKTSLRPKVGVVLGSGLGAFAAEIKNAAVIPYSEIPNFPRATAIGHAGRLVIGTANNTPAAVMQGRVHLYEGYSITEVAFPMRVMARMGIHAVVLTNAAGGINPKFRQGSLVMISDHINLQGKNPLTGPNDDRFGTRFPDMSDAYWQPYREIAHTQARALGIDTFEGVYASLEGPSYETPAEIRFLRTIGADLVGMSTVPTTIAARHMGVRVLGISCVTNMAAGVRHDPINHAEVLETGERVERQFADLLLAVLPRIAEDVPQQKRSQ
jgi:purine-nucleoside phosphorylase